MYRILAILVVSGTVLLWAVLLYAGFVAQKSITPAPALVSAHLTTGIISYPQVLPQTFSLPGQRY